MAGMNLGADAIVVAAGSSRRMGGFDKLGHEVAGRPLLAWSVEALAAAPVVERLVIVTSRGPGRVDRRSRVAGRAGRRGRRGWRPAARVRRRRPGRTRRARLDESRRPRGPRPRRGAAAAVAGARDGGGGRGRAIHGAAIPVVPVTDTLKRLDGEVVAGTVDRSSLAAAQTPAGRPERRCSGRRSSGSRRPAPRSGRTRPPCWRPVESRSMPSPVNRPTSR